MLYSGYRSTLFSPSGLTRFHAYLEAWNRGRSNWADSRLSRRPWSSNQKALDLSEKDKSKGGAGVLSGFSIASSKGLTKSAK